jgi:protein gp37
MGASVEDQQRLDERLPALLAIPAALHWLSLEPLLGPINLRSWLETCRRRSLAGMSSINWVAIGGETGPEARFCFVEDIESILEQCVEAPAPYGPVPCFVKQLGSRPASRRTLCRIFFDDKKGENMNEWPEGLQVREMPWRFYSARGREGGEANE